MTKKLVSVHSSRLKQQNGSSELYTDRVERIKIQNLESIRKNREDQSIENKRQSSVN
jgi:hypothetical protein